MDIVKDLKQYCLLRNLSQEKLANEIGVSLETVNRWFRGHNKPSYLASKRVIEYLEGMGYFITNGKEQK